MGAGGDRRGRFALLLQHNHVHPVTGDSLACDRQVICKTREKRLLRDGGHTHFAEAISQFAEDHALKNFDGLVRGQVRDGIPSKFLDFDAGYGEALFMTFPMTPSRNGHNSLVCRTVRPLPREIAEVLGVGFLMYRVRLSITRPVDASTWLGGATAGVVALDTALST